MHKENILKDLTNFVVYYGVGQEKKLLNYDLLIVEPKGHTDEGIHFLKKNKKTIIAYVSFLEISKNDEIFNLIVEDDFIKINNKIIKNEEYDTFYLDISKEKVQNLIIQKATQLLNCGYDGLFIDTVGNIDFLNIPYDYKEKLLNAVLLIFKKIKSEFENCILVQNNGIVNVCDYTNVYLDAICFENPPCKTFVNFRWTVSAFRKLHKLEKENNIEILVLQELKMCEKKLWNKFFVFIIRSIAYFKKYKYFMTKQYYNDI